MADPDALLATARAAIDGAFSLHDEMPTAWVMVATALGADGERGLWLMASSEAKPWEILGMLDYAQALEHRKIQVGNND